MFPQLGLPTWSETLVTVLLAFAFPIALLLAWAYELTPDGIRRTRQVPLESSTRHVTGQKLNYIVTGLLAAAVAFIVVDVYLIGADETPQSASPSPVDASLGDRAYEWLETAVERIESGNADTGFLALQTSFADPGNPAFSDARFQRLLERLEALRRID